LSTAHHAPDEPAPTEPTRVVYMPGRDLTGIAREWRAAGLPPGYPCVLVSRAGQPEQQVTRTTLGLLHVTSPGPAPVLLMGGAVFSESALGSSQGSDIIPAHIESDSSRSEAHQ
jgi:siroheme synthase